MTPQDVSWALDLRSKGLSVAEIARLLKVAPHKVPRKKGAPAPRHGSTFVNGRGWV